MKYNRASILGALPIVLSFFTAQASFELPSPEQADYLLLERVRARYDFSGGLESVPMMPKGSRVVGTHIVFDKKSDAFSWMNHIAPDMQRSFGAKKYKMVEKHVDEAKLQAYVDEIWSAFVELFPTHTEGLESPHVLVVDTEQSTAFVPSHEGLSLHVVVVMTGMIEKAGGVDKLDEITGNLAHEVAHSVFSHGTHSISNQIQRFFMRDEKLLGFESGLYTPDKKGNRNRELNLAMERYVSLVASSGELTSADLLDLPSPAYGTPMLQKVWSVFRRQAASAQQPICVEEASVYSEWSKLMPFASFSFKNEITEAQPKQLLGKSTELVTKGEQCFAPNKNAFVKAYASLVGVPESTLLADPEFKKMNALFNSESNPSAGLRKVVRASREEMRKVEAQPFFKKLGYYTTEQHADDASAIVHAYLGRNPGAFGQLLRISMSRYNPNHPALCDKMLANGEVPDLGSLLVLHHSNCYRLYNFGRMKDRMANLSKAEIKAFAQDFLLKSHQD